MKANDTPVIVEQTFSATIATVWSAITEVDQMRQWFFENIPAFKPEVGFETQFNVESEGRNFLHLWQVTQVVPLKMITCNWKYEGYAGDSFVAFELFEENDSTRLRVTHQVTQNFPDDIPEFLRESCVAGWTFFIKERLDAFLARPRS